MFYETKPRNIYSKISSILSFLKPIIPGDFFSGVEGSAVAEGYSLTVSRVSHVITGTACSGESDGCYLVVKGKTISYDFRQPEKTFTQLFPCREKTNSGFGRRSSFTQ